MVIQPYSSRTSWRSSSGVERYHLCGGSCAWPRATDPALADGASSFDEARNP